MSKVEQRCITPECVSVIQKYGEHYHKVYALNGDAPDFMPDATCKCDRCGGFSNGTDWKHVCKPCGKEVQPGQLTGLFVPHRCAECQAEVVAKERAAGQVCHGCNDVLANCCC